MHSQDTDSEWWPAWMHGVREREIQKAVAEQEWRERSFPPDRRLDDVGWQIFFLAIEGGARLHDAAVLAMDGTLRQRRAVREDMQLRSTARLFGVRPKLHTRTIVAPEQRLAFWRGELAEPQFVYFVARGEDGPIKIGRAGDPDKRLAQLQTGSPDDLLLRDVVPGQNDLERSLHQRFAPARIRGEWFGAEYLPVILAFAQGLADDAVAAYDHSGHMPTIVGSFALGDREALKLRGEIERLWIRGLSDGEILKLLDMDQSELTQHLSAMRQTTLYPGIAKPRRSWGRDVRST